MEREFNCVETRNVLFILLVADHRATVLFLSLPGKARLRQAERSGF